MTTKEFVECAVKGGWTLGKNTRYDERNGLISDMKPDGSILGYGITIHDMTDLWLDPEAWKAVGKVKGWHNKDYKVSWKLRTIDGSVTLLDIWENHMHSMIYALSMGKTLEEYIATL